MPAILLIPGLNCSARVFSDQIPVLWRYGPVTIADHRPGGTIAEIARNVLASAPPSFVMLGFSLGGYIALEIMRQAPERIEKLILVATNARPDTEELREKRQIRIARVEAGGFDEDLRTQFPNSVHPSRAGDEALFELYRTMAFETGSETFIRQSRAVAARPDQRDLLPRIACPTLVVAAEGDKIQSEAWTSELATGIPGAKKVTIAQSGHFLPIEQPERLNAVLAEWLGA